MTSTQSLPVDKIAEIRNLAERATSVARRHSLTMLEIHTLGEALLAILTPASEKPHEDTAHHADMRARGALGGTGVGPCSLPHVAPTSKATAVSRERVQDLVSDWAAALWPNTHVELLKQNALVSLRDAILNLIGRSGDAVTDYAELATDIAERFAEVPRGSTWEDTSAYVAKCLLRFYTILKHPPAET